MHEQKGVQKQHGVHSGAYAILFFFPKRKDKKAQIFPATFDYEAAFQWTAWNTHQLLLLVIAWGCFAKACFQKMDRNTSVLSCCSVFFFFGKKKEQVLLNKLAVLLTCLQMWTTGSYAY